MTFETLGIHQNVLKALHEIGYQQPTPIQTQAIPKAIAGQDILGLAQTGTGKTASFAIPIIQQLMNQPKTKGKRPIKSLIITPTRELAIQIKESIDSYSTYTKLKTAVIFGGVGQYNQVRQLQAGIDILVATPGRLLDLMNQKYIKLDQIEIFVLDEADRMLDMGFIHDVRKVLKALPQEKQTLLFSATMPKEIHEIVNQFLVKPATISVTPVSSTVDAIKQSVYLVDNNHKNDILTNILKDKTIKSVLVFTRTKHGADKVAKQLNQCGIMTQAIHGNKSQNARQNALKNFKNNKTRVLIATDIASRGIDIDDLAMVVNYDLPEVSETYVHRIGRTGRAGHDGVAISLVNHQDKPLLKGVEKLIKQQIKVEANEQYPIEDFSERVKKPQRNQRKNNHKAPVRNRK